MKTSFAQISKAYQDYLSDEKPGANTACPELERLVQCTMLEGYKKERAEVIAHAVNCADCAQGLKCMLDISEEIDKLAERADAFRKHRHNHESREKKAIWSRVSRNTVAAILTVLLGITVIAFSILKLTDHSKIRGRLNTQILLFSPVAKASLPIDEIRFRWETLPNAKYFTVELFDKSLELVWRSGPLGENKASLPAAAGREIIQGETYYWRVTAVLDDDMERKSRLAEFSIKK
jgi:ABC-type sugar transport system permease subunit